MGTVHWQHQIKSLEKYPPKENVSSEGVNLCRSLLNNNQGIYIVQIPIGREVPYMALAIIPCFFVQILSGNAATYILGA